MAADHFARIEHLIYEAAVVPDRWPAALHSLSEVGEGIGTVLFSVTDSGSQWTASAGIHAVMQKFVADGWATRNTRMSNGFRKGLHLLPRFVSEQDFYDPGEMERDPLHTEFLAPNGIGSSAGTIASLPHGDMLCFSVEKKRKAGRVSDAALARLDSLRPHLVRAAMMTARLGLERVRTAVDTLTQLGFAAAAVDQRGGVVVANSAFETESQPWTTRAGNRIALLDRGADQLLRLALEAIAGSAGVRSIPLRNAEMVVRHVLHVVPVRRTAHDIFTRASAILVITTAVGSSGEPALLQALFDLTPAEAALARKIGSGQSLDEIAAERGRTVTTLRNQLKSVLAKTACRRQAELVGLLARLVPPAL